MTAEERMEQLAELGVDRDRIRSDWTTFQTAYNPQPSDQVVAGCLFTVYVVERAITEGEDPIHALIRIDIEKSQPGRTATS